MKSGDELEAQRSDSKESQEEDIFSELDVPPNFVASFAASLVAINTCRGENASVISDVGSVVSDDSFYSGDLHFPLTPDFTGRPHSSTAGQIFVSNGAHDYIIDTSSFSENTFATISAHGWLVSHIIPDEYKGSSVLVDLIQIANKLGIRPEILVFEEDEPSYHELTKHSDDKDDGGDSERHFGSSGHLPAFSVSNLIASSDSKEKASSATSIGGTTASLALNSLIVISAMMAMSSLTGSGYFDSNSIVDSFKHNLLEGIDYYMIS